MFSSRLLLGLSDVVYLSRSLFSLDQVIKGVGILIALIAVALWKRSSRVQLAWNAAFCFLAGVFSLAAWIKSGISSFDTDFYGILFLLSLVVLTTKMIRKDKDALG